MVDSFLVKPLIASGSGTKQHSIHAYFNASPERPDRRYVLYYASGEETGYGGEIRILERSTGREIVLSRQINVEDAHRTACQQWVARGRLVVFQNVLMNGEWEVRAVDVENGGERILARGRQLGMAATSREIAPLYGPPWSPGDHRGLELLNVQTGEIKETALTPQAVTEYDPDWIARRFGRKPVSIFFPVLSPDGSRVIFKVATPANGEFRRRSASNRCGLFCYDIENAKVLFRHDTWGHPAWHPDSRHIINRGGLVIGSDTGACDRIPGYPACASDHPSFSPDGKRFVTDTRVGDESTTDRKASWAVLAGNVCTGKSVLVQRFGNAGGARSWRASHPHPVFSPDGKRIYFNVSETNWTRLYVAEKGRT